MVSGWYSVVVGVAYLVAMIVLTVKQRRPGYPGTFLITLITDLQLGITDLQPGITDLKPGGKKGYLGMTVPAMIRDR